MRRTRLPNVSAREFLRTMEVAGHLDSDTIKRLSDAYKSARTIRRVRHLTPEQFDRGVKRINGESTDHRWPDAIPLLKAALADPKVKAAIDSFVGRERIRLHGRSDAPEETGVSVGDGGSGETPTVARATTDEALKERRKASLVVARQVLAEKREAEKQKTDDSNHKARRRVAATA